MDSSVIFFSIVAVLIGGFLMLLGKLRFKEQNSSSLSSSSSLSLSSVPLSSLSRPTQTYHVFPSFRGQDVRRDFFSHIQTEFQRKGITLFIDNNITRGQPIGPELLLAIRASKIAIILISRSYASSKWCLDELVEIMKCRELLGQTVIPIFYGVDPSDVKKLAGDFGKVFRETCAGKTEDNIKRWKHALEEVSTIAGYHSTNWDNEATMIKKMATDISDKLKSSTLSCYFDGLVGMRAYLVKMETLVGLCSIAASAYNKVPSSSQLSDFMENVKAKYTRPCSVNAMSQLQQQFMPHITNHKNMRISHSGHLVKLDGPSSPTTIRASKISDIYMVDFPLKDEILQLFCMCAFDQKYPTERFEVLARKVAERAGRLPLGIKIFDSKLWEISRELCIEMLPKLRARLDADDTESILEFGYDPLDDEYKVFFLLNACLNYEEVKKVDAILAKKFLNVKQRLQLLTKKSLIHIDFGYIRMPLLRRQLARKIVPNRQLLLSNL